MRGLLLKDFYMTVKYCKMFFLVDLFFIVFSFFPMKDNVIFMLFPAVMSGVISITMLSYDERCKWTSYSGALPYSNAQIVSEKYLFGLIIQAATALVIFGVMLIRINLMGGTEFTIFDAAQMVGAMFFVSLVMPAFCLPFCFGFGAEKGRLFFCVVMGVITAFSAQAVQWIEDGKISNEVSVYIPCILLGIVMIYALSWRISIPLYGRRSLKG